MNTTLIECIHRWQELIGALIGGSMGFIGAFIVVYAQRRREENSAAMLLIGDLTVFEGSIDEVLKAAKNFPKPQQDLFIVSQLIRLRSSLSPLFETARSQVMPVDQQLLAPHLHLFQMIYNNYIQALERLSVSLKNDQPLSEDNQQDINVVIRGIKIAQSHAKLASYYLHNLFVTPQLPLTIA